MINLPDFLQFGDSVAIVSPSGPIDANVLDAGIEILTSWGLIVEVGAHAYSRAGVFAGSDAERAADFQAAIDNPKIRAIFCSRGGYGAIRIVQKIDFSACILSPKWIVGFSDITVFHAKMQSLTIASIHGAMPKNFTAITPSSLESLQNVLFGNPQAITIESVQYNKVGDCSGQLVGGNLSMLYSMRGLPFEYDYSNKILFIEDLNEYLYHIDRIMQNLKLSGILSQIAGLVVGTMSGMKNGLDVFESSLEGLILEAVKEYNYPVCFNFPAGHESLNQAMIFGGEYNLKVSETKCILEIKNTLS